MVEITATEQNIEKRMKRNEYSLRDLWDNIKCINICVIGVPEGEERDKGPEKIFEEIIAENFLNMGNEIVNQVQEAQSPNVLFHLLLPCLPGSGPCQCQIQSG